MSDLDALLVVQEHDTTIDQLGHRRAGLPEREELAKKKVERSKTELEISEVETARHEVEREQRRFEDEVAVMESRVASANNKLYNGTMTSTKEAQGVQAEISSLESRQAELEGSVIELMVQMEPHTEQLGSLREVCDAIDQQITMCRAGSRITKSISMPSLQRNGKLAPPQLLGSPMRCWRNTRRFGSQMGGVAVAKLAGDRCMGCSLGLPAAEYDRVKRLPADAIVHCFECGRLLVR